MLFRHLRRLLALLAGCGLSHLQDYANAFAPSSCGSAHRVGRHQRRWFHRPRPGEILLNTENQDIFGIGLGGRARYTFGRKQSVSIQLAGFYAPDILTFGEADDVSEVSTRLDLAFNSALSGFIGYRIFNVGLLGVDKRVDDGVQLGFRRTF